MLIVAMGWPHVLLRVSVLLCRVARRTERPTFVPAADDADPHVWVIHYNYLITGLIYIYFLYHAFRDEIFVYLQTRHDIERARGRARWPEWAH